MASYSCTYVDCQSKTTNQRQVKEQPFVPFRLLVCGHSICDLCVLDVCKQQKEFIKCTVCSFNTTITEVVQRNVIQNELEIKRWLDPTSITAPEVLRFDSNLFPLDFYQIGNGVHSGVLSATKTAEMIDLDLDDDSAPVVQLTITQPVMNSHFEDDSIVRNVISRIPRTAPEKFRQSVETGVNTFSELSQNHTSIKRSSDETKEWFKKIRLNAREMFHKMHSILQNREKEMMEEITVVEDSRQQELRVFMNEILSTRSELKGKVLQSPQLQTDRDRNALKKSIDRLVKDSNVISIQSPQKEYKFLFENSIESHLKKFGKVERLVPAVVPEADNQNGAVKEVNNRTDESIDVSSDEDVEDSEITDVSQQHQKIDREVVTVLQMESPTSFYVQKESDKERFDCLNEEMTNICSSPYYHSPAWDTLKPGEYVFAYSLKMRCWCRATLIHIVNQNSQKGDPIYLAEIVLIDYGSKETVQWYNIREKKVELFDDKKWPPFAYSCALYGVKPHRKTGHNWNKTAVELFSRYVKNNQLVLIDFGTKDGITLIDLIHYDVPGVTYQIPSVIEVMLKNEEVSLTENIDFNAYCRYKCQPLTYSLPETPKLEKTMSVLVSHVESPDLFYVHLQRQYKNLMALVDEINESYNSDNVGIYTYYCPKTNTVCAALFDGDNKFYRALVLQKGKNVSEFIVQFVDFGNRQTVQTSNLRLLKDTFLKLPIQALPCGLIHVDPAFGFKWNENATAGFKYAISNERGPQILTMSVYETKQFAQNMPKLMVVLRSYDGDNGIKINELIVRQRLGISTGYHSKPDYDRHMLSSQESIDSISSSGNVGSNVRPKTVLPYQVSAFLVIKDLMERFKCSQADKRSSLIKVFVCSIQSPSEFYVQIERPEVKAYFETHEKDLHESCSSERFVGNIPFEENELCAFTVNNNWRRGKVVRKIEQLSDQPEETRYSVLDMDYGSEKEITVSLMRKLSDEFAKDGSFALKCQLYCLRPTGGDQWSNSAKDEFKDYVRKYSNDLSILIKGSVENEPISVILYSRQTIIPGAFSKQKTVYESINTVFVDKGLATYDRSKGLVNGTESDDDKDMNAEAPPPQLKTQMPFSMYSSTESVLGSLQQRLSNDTDSHKIGEKFLYRKEEYPREQSFYGLATDLESHTKEYWIAFRYWFEDEPMQPLQKIESNIQDVLNNRGELEPFVGPYTTSAGCTAYFDFDKTWNRAEIVGVTQTDDNNNKMCVRFVDYGNQESLLVDKLSSEVFAKETPKLALKCQLINIKPSSDEAHKEIKNLIYTRILDHKCRFFWENHPKLPMKVTLEIREGEEYIPFLEFLERRNLLANRFEDNEAVDDIMNINPIVDKIYGLYPIVFQFDRFYEVVMSFFIGANYAFFQPTELRNPSGKEEIINAEHDSFLNMLEQMRAEVDTFPFLRTVREGLQCVAKYVDDCWYRGLIISVDNTQESVMVFFIDHGNTDPITIANLRELPKKYLKPKAHSLLCQIANIRPPNDQTWSRNANLVNMLTERLTDVSEDEKLFARFKSLKYPLKIDLYRCDPNNQSVPGKHVFQDFVDKGLLDYCDSRDVWRKPIEATQSYKSLKNMFKTVKTERTDNQ